MKVLCSLQDTSPSSKKEITAPATHINISSPPSTPFSASPSSNGSASLSFRRRANSFSNSAKRSLLHAKGVANCISYTHFEGSSTLIMLFSRPQLRYVEGKHTCGGIQSQTNMKGNGIDPLSNPYLKATLVDLFGPCQQDAPSLYCIIGAVQ